MKKLVVLLLAFLLVVTGCKSVEVTKVKDDINTDAIKFSEEYENIGKNNLFTYATYDNIIDTIKSKTGIIYLGFPACSLCKEVVPILNEVASKSGIKEILYYDFRDIRNNNTEEYQFLSNLLADYIKEDADGNKKIQAPTFIFVSKGKIVGVYIGHINSDAEQIITEEEKESLRQNLLGLINKMQNYKATTKETTSN